MSLVVNPEDAALILIDAQPAFFDLMHGPPEPVLARLEHLLLLVEHAAMPCVATFEQPVSEKGWLPDRLEHVFPPDGYRLTKRTYNLCAEPDILEVVESLERPQMVVAGAETDVCVLQSVLGLLGLGYQVFLVEDCLFSAEPNVGPALGRMRQAGATPVTYKTLYFEFKVTVDAPGLHHDWNERHGDGTHRYVDPYDLPPFRR
jgi:nicotinamidase-related amidase